MADLKISQLSDGGASQATDEYVIARSGANYRIDGASIAAAATSVGTLSSLTVSGDVTVDTNTLKVVASTNRVGINTSGAPAYTLEVGGAVASNTSFQVVKDGSGSIVRGYGLSNAAGTREWTTQLGGSNDLETYYFNGTSWANPLTLTASGNLGLGVTPSAWASSYNAFQFGATGRSGALFVNGANDLWQVSNAFFNGSNFIYYANGTATAYNQASGTHKWSAAASGTAGDAISFTQVLAVEKDKSLALQGATSQTGTGITFPATQSASSDANTLDDYEEGTFAPTLVRGGTNPTVTYTAQSGSYTRVGRSVMFTAYVGWSANSGGSGGWRMGGLPFTVGNNDNNYSQTACNDRNGVTLDAGYTQFGGYTFVGLSSIVLVQSGSGVLSSDAPTIGNSGYIITSGHYYV